MAILKSTVKLEEKILIWAEIVSSTPVVDKSSKWIAPPDYRFSLMSFSNAQTSSTNKNQMFSFPDTKLQSNQEEKEQKRATINWILRDLKKELRLKKNGYHL